MMKVTSMIVYGVSRIEENDIASYTANVDASGSYTLTKSVHDRAAYTAHKSECDADFVAFEALVIEKSAEQN